MSVYTANYVADKQRREAVVEMMRAGDWRGVMDSFHGGEEARWGSGISLYLFHVCNYCTFLFQPHKPLIEFITLLAICSIPVKWLPKTFSGKEVINSLTMTLV